MMLPYLDNWGFTVMDEYGDDGDGEKNAETGDADGHQGQQGVPPHVLQVQIKAAVFVFVGPATGPAVGARHLILQVHPRIARLALPAAHHIPLLAKKKKKKIIQNQQNNQIWFLLN